MKWRWKSNSYCKKINDNDTQILSNDWKRKALQYAKQYTLKMEVVYLLKKFVNYTHSQEDHLKKRPKTQRTKTLTLGDEEIKRI